jgi:hypothetical protein
VPELGSHGSARWGGQQCPFLPQKQQLALFADRTSAHEMRSNQLRLYFSSFAYALM